MLLIVSLAQTILALANPTMETMEHKKFAYLVIIHGTKKHFNIYF